jgi:hypothetical protein
MLPPVVGGVTEGGEGDDVDFDGQSGEARSSRDGQHLTGTKWVRATEEVTT